MNARPLRNHRPTRRAHRDFLHAIHLAVYRTVARDRPMPKAAPRPAAQYVPPRQRIDWLYWFGSPASTRFFIETSTSGCMPFTSRRLPPYRVTA